MGNGVGLHLIYSIYFNVLKFFCKNKFSQIITEMCFNVLNYLNWFYIYISYILYILTYTYANVLNYILFYSILTNILCMFYVPFSTAMIAQSENKTYYYYTCMYYLFCTHYTYFICFIAVILNTLYAFYVLWLYTCLSENSSDELMLSNSHLNRR